MQNGTGTVEDSVTVSYKTKHILTIQFSNHAPWYLHKCVENLCLHKNLNMYVYISFIHNCQNLEAIKIFFNSEWINELWYIHITEYYSVIKRNELLSHGNTWRKLKCILLSERNQSQKTTYCMISNIWHWKRQIYGESKKLSGCQGLGGRDE